MVFFIYNILVIITGGLLHIVALFNKKIKLFITGRKDVFRHLKSNIHPSDKVVWFHTASLGEFEQGLPVIEEVRKRLPGYKILVTFFSPSGYEVKKNTDAADIVTYLPLDTRSNAGKFIDIVDPELVIFVKYEFWPNYLSELKKRKIKTLLISAIFREDQAFFKWYGGFMRSSLSTFDHFFVQDTNSKKLLEGIDYTNATVSGDTRFDRVSEILNRDNSLPFIETFKSNELCIVAGSTWPEDHELLASFINNDTSNTKYIIAPHNIKNKEIEKLQANILKKTVLFSKKDDQHLEEYQVFIIDTIGILTKIYSYADIAYVGGGMGTTGLHNTLEPAVFGIPVIIGKNYQKFKEAVDLVANGGITSIKSQEEFNNILKILIEKNTVRLEKGKLNAKYIEKKRGSKDLICKYIGENPSKKTSY